VADIIIGDFLKSGQIAGQVFVYIFIVILVGAIIIFGAKAIQNMSKKSDQAAIIRFKAEISNNINSMLGDTGSSKTLKYNLPSAYEEVCFVDIKNIDPDDISLYPMIVNSIESDVQPNVFLLTKDKVDTVFIENFELSEFPYFTCVRSKSGMVQIKMEGMGSAVNIIGQAYEKYCRNAEINGLCDALNIVFYAGYQEECCGLYNKCCP
jgi:hypothetical protein